MPALVLSACASSSTLDASSRAVSIASTLPPPDATSTAVDFTSYRIGPKDMVSVEVFGAPELKREGEVDAAGNLSMPLIGNIGLGGKTPTEAGQLIGSRLEGRYVRDPQVTVNILKAAGQTVTIDGAVREPGTYPIVGRMTLQQAIAQARGTADIANLDNVIVFRDVRSQRMAALFSLKRIRLGQMPDPQIYSNDIVIVGENATRRFLKDLGSVPALGSFVPFIL